MRTKTYFRFLQVYIFTILLSYAFQLPIINQYVYSQPIKKTNGSKTIVSNITISGKVLTSDGAGVNLVEIKFVSDVTQSVLTNSSGVYSLTTTSGKNYSLQLQKDRYLFSPINVTINNVQTDINNLNFTAYPFYRITGKVFDANNQVMPNIKILLSGNKNLEMLTTPAGIFVLDSLLRGNYTVTPSSSVYNFNPKQYSFTDLHNDAPAKYFYASEIPTYKISGYIRDENGNNLANADVILTGNSNFTTKSNIDGFYEFSGLIDGTYIIRVLITGYTCNANSRTIAISGSSIININFSEQKYYSISGTIKDKSNTPVPGAKLTLTGSKGGITYSNTQGLFAFDTIFTGSYIVTPELYSYIFSPPSIGIDNINSNKTGINFTAEKLELFTISGKVVDKNGKGLKNVSVVITGKNQFELLTLNDGSFTFNDIEKGSYLLSLACDGYTFLQQTIILNLDQSLENLIFNAFPVYKVTGYLKNKSGNALTNILIHLSNDSISKYCYTDIDGKYLFDSLFSGNYTVTPLDSTLRFNPEKIIVLNLNKNLSVNNIIGQKTYKISGRIIDPLHRPLRNIPVSLLGDDTITTYTDTTGYFNFINILESNVRLTFQSNGLLFDPPEINYLPISGNENGILISGYISLSGQVLSVNALPVSGIKILLQCNKMDSCISNGSGSFVFDRLPTGKYTLVPLANNFSFIPSQYFYDSLTACKHYQNFTAISNISISGKILDIKSRPLKNIRIELAGSRYTLTDSNGDFSFPDINPGRYTLKPVDSAYKFYPEKYECETISTGVNIPNFVAKKIINFAGKVTDYKDNPVINVKIYSLKDSSFYSFTDSKGSFTFKNIESGVYSFGLFKRGYYFSPQKLEPDTLTDSMIDINIKGYIKICGFVMDSTFMPVSKTDLTILGIINKTTVTNDYGFYEINNLCTGDYKLRVSKPGYTFYPKLKEYYNLETSIETDTFFANKLLSISGKIHDIKNRTIDNVILSLTGDTTILFQSVGEFNFINLNPGKYLLTPLKTGMKFNPQNITFNPLNKDYNNINFLGYITIAGKIADSLQNPKSGIIVALTGEKIISVVTDKTGFFLFDSLCLGKYIITPSNKNLNFRPENIIYQNLDCSEENINFTSSANSVNGIQKKQTINSSILLNNFPNPFNGSTTIKFSIEEESCVTLSIIDILGREVGKIIENKKLGANDYSIRWNSNEYTNISSGIYVYILQIKNGSGIKMFSKRMVLLK